LDWAENLTQGLQHMILSYDRSDYQLEVSGLRYLSRIVALF